MTGNKMTCPNCKSKAVRIQQAEDSRFKEFICLACGYRGWLKNLNKKSKNK